MTNRLSVHFRSLSACAFMCLCGFSAWPQLPFKKDVPTSDRPLTVESRNPVTREWKLQDSLHFIVMRPVTLAGRVTSLDVKLKDEVYAPFSDKMSPELATWLDKQPAYSYTTGTERANTLVRVRVKTIRNNGDGSFSSLDHYKIETENIIKYSKAPSVSQRSVSFAANSVLASGSGYWYKVGVVKDGVYKITYTALRSMGIDPDTVNPAHINIFGNSFGMLPDANSAYRPDDLVKNAIYIQGEGDGNFGPNDYILFYAKGPVTWNYNPANKLFSHKSHLYCDTSYYFINVNPGESPLRVTPATLSVAPANQNVNAFSDYAFHEADLVNFIKSGREWYGEEFDIATHFTFGFSFPGISTTDTAFIVANLAANTPGSNTSSFTVGVSNTTYSQNVVIGGVGTGQYTPAAVGGTAQFPFLPASGGTVGVDIDFNKFSAICKGWLNYVDVNVRRALTYSSGCLLFRDPRSTGTGNVADYALSSIIPGVTIWDVTNPYNVQSVAATYAGNTYSFRLTADSLREMAAFLPSSLPAPFSIGQVAPQDIHGLPYADMLIVTAPQFYTQALELAQFHENEGLTVHLVKTNEIYNEFSSGMRDACAIRSFARMFYHRAAGNTNLMPKYLLLFGDGSYDNKNRISGNTAFIPTYQSSNSVAVLSSYTSDDYFGLLDSTESFSNNDLLDIGIGRIVCKSTKEAADMVNKIKKYTENYPGNEAGSICGTGTDGNMGPWRNKVVLIGDDEDGGPYVYSAENTFYPNIVANAPQLDVRKIYFDAYTQTSTPGGQRYYDVERLIREEVQKGALLVNYIGHGGEVGWAHERVLDVPTIQEWSNGPRYPVFMTATCEFSRFDDPARTSAGEYVLLNPIGGGVALFTTTRVVYQSGNENLNDGFYDYIFDKVGNQPLALGEVCMRSKNLLSPADMSNARNFCLLGDPALVLQMPHDVVVTDSINGTHISVFNDTLKALSHVTITGHVEDGSGNVLTAYNGTVFPTVFDKIKNLTTLGQDPDSPVIPFVEWQSIVFKGKATVQNGYFSYSFVIPRDLNPAMGTGRISYYFHNNIDEDGHGYTENFKIGDINMNAPADNTGPEISLYMNGENFVDGGLTDESPMLVAKFTDENGINTVGTGIGHDITCVLDNNTVNTIVLNDYYETENNTYQKGGVNFRFSELATGSHTVKVKVWDTYNNSSEKSLDFVVADNAGVALDHVLNYPNPFTTSTAFYLEHNQMCATLQVSIDVLTISGKVVKSIRESTFNDCYRIGPIYWDGKDDYGDKLARGTYIYRVKVRTEDGEVAEKLEKLVILY